MNILGINGLGVLPSACLLQGGDLVAMAEEERFTRLKTSFGMMPAKASKFCLEKSALQLKDVDFIAFAWDCDFYKYKMPLFLAKQYLQNQPKIQQSSNVFKVIGELVKYNPSNVKRLIREMFRSEGIDGEIPPIKFIPHHSAHAASTFNVSPFDKAHILILDGSGENKCTSIWYGEGENIKELESIKIPHSLGWFYQSITEFLGFMPNNHEGKTMALAAYGKRNQKLEKAFAKIIEFDTDGKYQFNAKYAFTGNHKSGNIFSEELVELLGKPRLKHEEINQWHKDIAFAVQSILEEITENLVKYISKLPNYNGNLCIAGGVGLNCKMNGHIANLDCVKHLYLPPVSSDSGSAIGAAIILNNKKSKQASTTKLLHAYWGPEYSNAYIESKLEAFKVKYTKEENIENKVAELLHQEKIIAWFQGRMEIGSRALGARSILANPLQENISDFVNEKVKGREKWRPFAASILYERSTDFFTSNHAAPFMATALEMKAEMAEKIPSVVHIDNTTRPQLVKKEQNIRYWNLIKKFGELSGVYAVLNTSFNLNEEPIICTPEQALRSFFVSGIDYLAIGDYLIYK